MLPDFLERSGLPSSSGFLRTRRLPCHPCFPQRQPHLATAVYCHPPWCFERWLGSRLSRSSGIHDFNIRWRRVQAEKACGPTAPCSLFFQELPLQTVADPVGDPARHPRQRQITWQDLQRRTQLSGRTNAQDPPLGTCYQATILLLKSTKCTPPVPARATRVSTIPAALVSMSKGAASPPISVRTQPGETAR